MTIVVSLLGIIALLIGMLSFLFALKDVTAANPALNLLTVFSTAIGIMLTPCLYLIPKIRERVLKYRQVFLILGATLSTIFVILITAIGLGKLNSTPWYIIAMVLTMTAPLFVAGFFIPRDRGHVVVDPVAEVKQLRRAILANFVLIVLGTFIIVIHFILFLNGGQFYRFKLAEIILVLIVPAAVFGMISSIKRVRNIRSAQVGSATEDTMLPKS